MTDERSASPDGKPKGRIPPLVWIVIVLLVGWFVVMMVRKGEGPSTMPAAPATGAAPATPAGTANAPAPEKP